jgi:anhydro-N-acetylmuramic acid kinase
MTGRRARRIIGLMSGTSCDGVDAVLTEITGRGLSMRVKLIGHHHRAYPQTLRSRLLKAMAPAETSTQEICALNVDVGEAFAAATRDLTRRLECSKATVELIGSHGQTICHLPPSGKKRGSTLQIGDAGVIATRTGVAVASDFRQADVALGGQGAPLVPWTDYVLFRDRRRARVVQNIGGIANLTYLAAGGELDDVSAFDTGPGNMVIDEIVRRVTGGRQALDRNGRRAARGQIDPALLGRWLRQPYFRRRPPKSCGREEFGARFVERTLRQTDLRKRPDDVIATATALTARSIGRAYGQFLPTRIGRPVIDQIVLCGGGARNTTLREMLADEIPEAEIVLIDAFGIPDQAKEAVSFAMLAAACVDGVPANLPRVTGASRPAILGSITPA